MANDNLTLDASGRAVSAVLGTIEAAFSGDTVDIGLAALVTSSGAENARTATLVDASNPLPISDAGGSVTVDGTVAVTNVATIGTSVTPGTSAAHLGKAIDSPVGGTDTGVATLMRRIDTPAAVSPAVADWQELRGDSFGRLYVQTSGGSATGTASSVASSATTVTVLAANAARKGFLIFNDSTQIVYLKAGATASATSFAWKLLPGESIERMGPCYTGIIDGIWASANGNARVTEFT